MTIFRDGLFDGTSLIITGGGTGIGRQVALMGSKLGAEVAICGRRVAPLEAVAAEIESQGGTCHHKSCDIREPDQVAEFIGFVGERMTGAPILINNAGGQFPTTAETLSANGWTAVIRNNLNGTFNMTREAATQLMIPKNSGRIVNIIANIERGFPGMVHTGAARAGVENMTKTLAVEWARFGITVVAFAPGVVVSSGTKQYPKELLEMGRQGTPLKRLANEEEIANMIVFLASPAAQFITGCTVKADGGASIWGETWMIPDHDNG